MRSFGRAGAHSVRTRGKPVLGHAVDRQGPTASSPSAVIITGRWTAVRPDPARLRLAPAPNRPASHLSCPLFDTPQPMTRVARIRMRLQGFVIPELVFRRFAARIRISWHDARGSETVINRRWRIDVCRGGDSDESALPNMAPRPSLVLGRRFPSVSARRFLPQPWEAFWAAAPRHDRRSRGGRAVRPVDRCPHRDVERALPLHQRRGRPCPSASPAGAGRCRGDRRGHRDRGRSAVDRAPRRGPEPGAVVVDPSGRSARDRAGAGSRRYPAARDRPRARRRASPAASRSCRWPRTTASIAPAAILAALAERGFRRILIEGGADTVSRFLAAGCLDRLHVWWRRSSSAPGRSSLDAAADRAGRRGDARAHARPSRRRRAVRLRSQRSARADRPGEEVDVTDAHARAALAPDGAPARKPSVDRRRRQIPWSAARPRPSRTTSRLDRPIVGPEHPVRRALHDRVAECSKRSTACGAAPSVRAPDRSPCRCAGGG